MNLSKDNNSTLIYEDSSYKICRIQNIDSINYISKIFKQEHYQPNDIAKIKYEFELGQSLNYTGILKPLQLIKRDHCMIQLWENFEGTTLKLKLLKRSFSTKSFLKLSIKIAEIIEYLHSKSIIYQDINPNNFLVNTQLEKIKLLNFEHAIISSEQSPTIQTFLESSLEYRSPEQLIQMNKFLDYRSDIYSLGIMFYEMITGYPPFLSEDKLNLLHAHIAKAPVPPHKKNSSIPIIISNIVLKCLAKEPNERYQSCYGLKKDLEICLAQLEHKDKIKMFNCGTYDKLNYFQISQKLYGRKKVRSALLERFKRIKNKKSQLVLVSGHSGIGKTSLIQEINKPVLERIFLLYFKAK